MSRGPRPFQTLRDAIPIARGRGTVQMAERGPESLFDFTIASAKPVAFVCVKYTEHIRPMLADIARECDDEIRRFRSVTQDTTISCELWLRSRYGTWRFFRVTAGCSCGDWEGREAAWGEWLVGRSGKIFEETQSKSL